MTKITDKMKKTFVVGTVLFVVWLSAGFLIQTHVGAQQRREKPVPYADPATWGEWLLPTDNTKRLDCRLYVREIGKGPLVVVLHGGWGHSQEYLLDAFIPLANRFRFVFYDQRGSFLSPCDSIPTVEQHVQDLEALRNALKEEKLTLVAHSMGTYLAMRYAVEYPKHIKGLALLASVSARGPTKYKYSDIWKERIMNRPNVLAELKKHGFEPQEPSEPRRRWLHYRISQGAIYLHDVQKWPQLRGTFFYSFRAAETAKSMPAKWDYVEQLSSLPSDILVMMGEDDYLALDQHQEWAANASNVQLKIVPAAGHNLWIDQPKIFRQTLVNYLAKAGPWSNMR